MFDKYIFMTHWIYTCISKNIKTHFKGNTCKDQQNLNTSHSNTISTGYQEVVNETDYSTCTCSSKLYSILVLSFYSLEQVTHQQWKNNDLAHTVWVCTSYDFRYTHLPYIYTRNTLHIHSYSHMPPLTQLLCTFYFLTI